MLHKITLISVLVFSTTAFAADDATTKNNKSKWTASKEACESIEKKITKIEGTDDPKLIKKLKGLNKKKAKCAKL